MTGRSESSANLGKRFEQHLFALGSNVSPTVAQALWQNIATHYNETVRVYHNLAHLQQLFIQLEQVKNHLKQPHINALALFYHDVIYNPLRTDNELKSAEYALDDLSAYLSAEQCQRVYQLIMMTADHQLDDARDNDGAFLLDMDLSILGTDWPEYKKYAQAIRQEYAHVPLADYKVGRAKVLTGLRDRTRLYLTDYYYQRLEKQARENIKHEVNLLHAA